MICGIKKIKFLVVVVVFIGGCSLLRPTTANRPYVQWHMGDSDSGTIKFSDGVISCRAEKFNEFVAIDRENFKRLIRYIEELERSSVK